MVTRRQFLIGAGATGAVGVAGGGVATATHLHGVHRFLHARGVLGGPDQAVPDVDATVTFDQLQSSAMQRDVDYGVYQPRAPAEAMLICLHGRGGNSRDPFEQIGMHKFVAAAGLPWAVAAVDGGESFWHARADGTDAQRLVLDELVPAVRAHAPDAVPLLIGWSMGAYGALLIGEQHPDAFRAIAASSPSVWRSANEATAGAFDDADDFARNDVLAHASALEGARVRIDCGDDDVFADVSRELLAAAPGSSGGVHAGYHESPTWRSFVPDQLEFLKAHVT